MLTVMDICIPGREPYPCHACIVRDSTAYRISICCHVIDLYIRYYWGLCILGNHLEIRADGAFQNRKLKPVLGAIRRIVKILVHGIEPYGIRRCDDCHMVCLPDGYIAGLVTAIDPYPAWRQGICLILVSIASRIAAMPQVVIIIFD